MKDLVKKAIGGIASSRFFQPVSQRLLKNHVNVVYYHRIGESAPYYSSFYGGCTFERFRRDIEQLANTFRFGSLEQVCQQNEREKQEDIRPLLAITFDDGFRINQPRVLELFDNHNIRATTFVTTACIDNQDLMWRNKLSAVIDLADAPLAVSAYNELAARCGTSPVSSPNEILMASRDWEMRTKDDLANELWEACRLPALEDFLTEYQPYLTWQDLDEWHAAGHSIGFHTRTHPFCSRLDEDEIDHEIGAPARELRKRFSLDVLPFSYPFGDRLSSERERRLVEDGVVDSIFGICGLAPRGTPAYKLERAGLEKFGVSWPVFGHMVMARTKGFLRR